MSRIRGASIDELRAIDWVPRSVRFKAREVEKAYTSLENKLKRPPSDAEIAEEMNVTKDELGRIYTQLSTVSMVALAVDRHQLVERHHRNGRKLRVDAPQLVLGDVHLLGDLRIRRRPLELVLEARVGLLDLARLESDRAGYPVDCPELVDDGAADAANGVRLELDASVDLVLLDGIHQPEDPVGDEVGLLDVRGETDRHSAGHVLDQRRVVEDQLVA